MLLVLLIAILVAILVCEHRYTTGELIGPTTLFVAGFLFSALWTLAYSGTWYYRMSPAGFAVVAGGTLVFAAVCWLVKHFAFRDVTWEKEDTVAAATDSANAVSSVSTVVLTCFIALQVIIGIWTIVRIAEICPAPDLATSIARYKVRSTFTTASTYLGFPLNPLRFFCTSGAYVMGYFFVERLSRRHFDARFWLLAVSSALNFALVLEDGGRTEFAVYGCYLVIVFLWHVRNLQGGAVVVNRRMVVVAAVAFTAFIVLFQVFAVGRYDSYSLASNLENTAVYCGSEIRNLDWWLTHPLPHNLDLWGAMTFAQSIRYLGPKLGIAAWTYTLDLPDLSYAGHWLGNVYTTFYAFLYDFGPVGLVVLTALMAAISESVFCASGRAHHDRDLWAMIYGYLAPQLLLSFFSNKFYENFCCVPFVRVLFVFVVMRWALTFDWRAWLRRHRMPNVKKVS